MQSETYEKALELTRRHHRGQQKTFSGQFTWKQRGRIKEIIDRFQVKSILDYGCGKGKQYRNLDENDGKSLVEYWGLKEEDITLYDPGVDAYAKKPNGKYDLVMCVQVLGSIPREDLWWVVDELYSYARKAIFVAERIKIPRKQIYKDIAGKMPFGMTGAEWLTVLNRPNRPSVMIAALKDSEFEPGRWHVTEFNKTLASPSVTYDENA